MIYLILIVVVASAGILRLWVVQRRERPDAGDIDGWRKSLRRMAESTGPAGPGGLGGGHVAVHRDRSDEDRRSAARRRIEALRRAGGSG